jgi:hypothetical protein
MRKKIVLSLFLTMVLGLTSVPVFATMISYNFGGGTPGTVTALGGGEFSGAVDINNLQVMVLSPFSMTAYSITGGTLDFNTFLDTLSISGNAGAFGSGTLLTSASFSFTETTGTCVVGDPNCDISFSGSSNLGNFTGFTDSDNASGSSWSAYSNSLTAMTNVTPVPEPSSLLLFASGFAFAGRSLRNRLNRK